MTLEDFFTLTEMKDGLTALARVEELVSIMRKEKDVVLKNVGEAARQWSTVASTLAATENKDSLDHFIRLDGLYFLDQWLQEVVNCGSDMIDMSVEESISALLGALKKLPIEYDMSISSGIKVTVKNLFGHESIRVQEGARALFDSWNQGRGNDSDHRDVEKEDGCHDVVKPAKVTSAVESGYLEHSAISICSDKRIANEDIHMVKPAGSEWQHSRSSDVSQLETVKDVKIPISKDQDASDSNFSQVVKDDLVRDTQDLSTLTPCKESFPVMEQSSIHSAERISSGGICSSPVAMESSAKARFSDLPELKDFTNDVAERHKCSQDKVGRKETCAVFFSSGSEHIFSADPANAQQSVVEPAVLNDVEAKESEFFLKKNVPSGLDSNTNTLASEVKSNDVDCGVRKHSRSNLELKTTDQAGASYPLQDLTMNGCILQKPGDSETAFSMEEDIAVNDAKELDESILTLGAGADSATTDEVSNPTMDTKISDKIDKRKLDVDRDFVEDDALEVAWQVAKEVEQAVVDYREPLCSSSSEKNLEAGIGQPGSPDSINGKQDQCVVWQQKEMPPGQNPRSGSPLPKGEDHLIDPNNVDKTKDCVHNQDASQGTEAALESANNTKMSMRDFDLNEDIHTQEMGHPRASVSASITVVSASRAAAPEFPVAPLHFEGELGWKGSAATSAFRPAPHRRISDGEKVPSVEGSSNSSKQRQDFLNIDLNVAEGNGDGTTDLILAKEIPISSGLPSGESSIEVSSRKAEKLKLDLNRTDDNDDVAPSDWRIECPLLFNHRNGYRDPSPASSSSSKQPMKNIDLNDNPSLIDSYDQQPSSGKSSSQNTNTCGGSQLDDSIISIMGKRVAVNRKEIVPQTWSFLPNGQVAESSNVANFSKSVGGVGEYSGMAYPPLPVFGHNGLSLGPSMSLSPAMCGSVSVPYMVDSRGIPVAPQLVGSQMVIATSSRSPFPMGTNGAPSGFNMVGPKLPNLDLNSGLTVAEAESREPVGLRQLFNPGQAVMTEEQMRSMKRKEPDGGWDSHPVIFKQKSPRP